MKVDFLVIGAMKSATTSLCEVLNQHPKIYIPKNKEPQFFSDIDWRLKLDDYHKNFKKKGKIYGEGSTNYSKHPFFNQNIHSDLFEYNPNFKFIYILRNPIERIISHYVHAYNRGYEKSSFQNAIRSNSIYIQTSKYYYQIKPYFENFGENSILILFTEDFKKYPQEVSDNLFNFLHVEPIKIKALKTNQSNHYRLLNHDLDRPKKITSALKKLMLYFKNDQHIYEKPIIDNTTKQYIIEQLHDDIKSLEKLTNRDLSHWIV